MLRRLALPAILLSLAGCGDGADKDAAPVAAEGVVFRPGRWRVENTIAGGIRQTEHLCVTEDQARSGRFLAGDLPQGCTVERDQVADGRIDLAIQCGVEGRTVRSTVQGTYGPDTYRVESTVNLGGGQAMRVTSSASYAGEQCQEGDVGRQAS